MDFIIIYIHFESIMNQIKIILFRLNLIFYGVDLIAIRSGGFRYVRVTDYLLTGRPILPKKKKRRPT